MICKQLVTQYEGTIWLKSELDKGSTFTFKIKLQQDEGDSGSFHSVVDAEEIQPQIRQNYEFKFMWKPEFGCKQKIRYVQDLD